MSNKEVKIQLPRTTAEGKPRISFSQYKSWKSLKSFNLGIEGKMEYMVNYFMGHKFPDKGWGEFGHDVEDYITERIGGEKFTDDEKGVLEKIKTIGVFQDEFELDMGDFIFMGIIDDRAEDWSIIRDYKTASLNSSKQYYGDEYKQLDFYALKAISVTKKIPKLEVCIIERKGNCMFTGGREVLTVGENIWYVERETSTERLAELEADLRAVVLEISEAFKVYQMLNKVTN